MSLCRSGAPALRCRICCRCLGSGAPARRCTICCRCLGFEVGYRTKMYDLLPVSWSRSSAPALRCMICCRCLDLEVVPPHSDVRCVAGVLVSKHNYVRFVAGVLVSKWCPSTKMYDLLPVSWSRSGAPALRCTICCRCLGLEVVPQH